MSEKYINDSGKEVYRGVTGETPFASLEFHGCPKVSEEDFQRALHTNMGSLTVLDRLTGFGYRDIETGFRDPSGEFWLASGLCDVILAGPETMQDAIDWVKKNANTCVGSKP